MRNTALDKSQSGIKIARRNINNLRYADDTTLMAESEGRTKEPLDESERGEWKSWLKAQRSENEDHGIWSHHFMGNRWGNSVRLYFWGAPKSLQMVTAAMKLKDAYSLEEKLWTTSILKSRYITLPTKVRLVKAMVFLVVMYRCESWTLKKAECRRIDAFELWCWRTLERPLDWKEFQPVHPKGNQSWIFIWRTDAKAEPPVLWLHAK